MKIQNIEIYRLDERNYTYRVYRKLKGPRSKQEEGYVESHKYYGNVGQCINAVYIALVNDRLEDVEDVNQALIELNKLKFAIEDIVKINV